MSIFVVPRRSRSASLLCCCNQSKKALESAAARVGVDEEWLLRNLKRNALMAMRHRNRAAANRALELISKHLGMFIERRSVALAAHDDADEYLAKLEALIAGEDVADDDGGGSTPIVH